MSRKSVFLLFILLTIVNTGIFFFREKFQYQSYAAYKQLYAPCDAPCKSKWEKYVQDFPAQDLNTAKKITDSITQGAKNAFEKAIFIGRFLHNKFSKQEGLPSGKLLRSSPWQQYQQLSANNRLQLWCSNYAQMFSYFCWSQGIVTRNIEIMKPGDHHVVSECYLPHLKRWMLVDLTNNLLAATANGGAEWFYNFSDFRTAIGDSASVMGYREKDRNVELFKIDTAGLTGYYQKDFPAFYYHRMDYFKATTNANKLKQYFFPVSWYDIYHEKGANNFLFYLKLVLLLLWLVSFFVFLFTRPKFKA